MLFAHDYILWVLYMCVVCRRSCVHMGKSENSLWELVLSFHCAGPRDWAQIIRLGGRCLYRVSCISGPVSFRIRLELWIFARNSTEATWPSHPIISRVHTITMWFMTIDIDFDHLTEMVFVEFLNCKVAVLLEGFVQSPHQRVQLYFTPCVCMGCSFTCNFPKLLT